MIWLVVAKILKHQTKKSYTLPRIFRVRCHTTVQFFISTITFHLGNPVPPSNPFRDSDSSVRSPPFNLAIKLVSRLVPPPVWLSGLTEGLTLEPSKELVSAASDADSDLGRYIDPPFSRSGGEFRDGGAGASSSLEFWVSCPLAASSAFDQLFVTVRFCDFLAGRSPERLKFFFWLAAAWH